MISNQLKMMVDALVADKLSREAPKVVEKEVTKSLAKKGIVSSLTDPSSITLGQAKSKLNGTRERAMANVNEVYGKVFYTGNQSAYENDSLYKNMKNKINYGFNSDGFTNEGKRRVI